MGFRTDFRLPSSKATISSTTTVLGSVRVTPVSGAKICVTGWSVVYGTAQTGPFSATLIETTSAGTAVTLGVLANLLSSSANTLFYPVVTTQKGSSVTLQATCSAGAQTIDVSLLYYYDDSANA